MSERAKFWTLAVLFGLIVNIMVVNGVLSGLKALAVHAAPSQPDACEPIAHAAGIDYYFCEPDDAPAFLANSMGFMQVVE